MRRCAAFAVLVALCLLSGCDTDSQGVDASESWASEAENVVALLVDAYDLADPYQTARFFTAGGSLDLTIWGQEVARTPEEVVEAVQQLWFHDEGFASVATEHLFVSPDSAVVWWWAYSNDGLGGQDWVQSYSFGAGGRTASAGFRGMEYFYADHSSAELAVLDLYDRYVAAWAAGDQAAIASLYAPDALVRDDLRGNEWQGTDELTATLDNVPPIQPGPSPHVYVYESGDRIEAIVLIQLDGNCPMLEARRWILDGNRIVREVRFTHVPSARRCELDLPEGWWTTFELSPELQDNVTEIIDVGGSLVDLVNAEPDHEAFARWLFDRYIESGIGVPEVSAVWFPPALECAELGGLAVESDERYEGRNTVAICFGHERLTSDRSESGWFETAASIGLHELAHIWMFEHLTDETRAAFNEAAGLSTWRGKEVGWRERGIEHAAFTIAWGLAGVEDARYQFVPRPDCETLAGRYELLTGQQPITFCGEYGWTP